MDPFGLAIPIRMKRAALALSQDDLRAELGELRGEIERLSAELEEMRNHTATLEALALEDPLTGLLNRRGFMRDLSRAIAYRARYGTPTALMLADLDRFKPINDTYGHEVGDRALEHLSGLLRGNIRASDCLGRLGGDEFALILWQVDEELACRKAAALQAIVAATPLTVGGLTLPLGASIGVTLLEPADTPEEALMRADQAMYRQKAERKGRRAGGARAPSQAMISGVIWSSR
jgi:diguanylate cyclase (GGDEF)-like protein